ncbi:MAG: helix-turn-helix transcriptional regulator [Anaerovoracaceae bacterium]
MSDKIKYEEIGGRIKLARREAGISQERLAEVVGVCATHISHVENGKSVPSVKVLIGVMNCLKVTPNQIFGGSVETSKSQLLKETEMIFKDCSVKEASKLNRLLEMFKKFEQEE